MQDDFFAPNSCYERKGKIVWANSMASRGKMMGKATFDTVEENAHDHNDISDIELCTNLPVAQSPLVDPSLQSIPRSCHGYIRYSFHIAHRMAISHGQLQSDHIEVLRTALLSKQKALRCIKDELQVQPEMNSDAVIAAVLLFVNLDVVEFGGRGWKYHLRGAEELIRVRKGLVKGDSEGWLRYFDTTCTTFGILGSTLVPSHSLRVVPMPLDSTLLDTIRRSEHLTWIGCPASLLSLLHAMNTLRAIPHDYGSSDKTVGSIIGDLKGFSPLSWATDFPDPQHHESRYHLAYAYKAGVSIYASHIIREILGQPSVYELDTSRLRQLGISHMSQISVNDFHIKSLVWPAFILGAETQDHDTREKVRTVMHDIWVSSCCYNVRTALGMLDRI
ncbi:Acriflavine sensitivity control acr-2 [Fusarium acutatum]|uniref:Acriflavine sensitivity control acr-2 n=1 Tax=Fusarium acutatum TaxID=78861 RepID=A0A8H4JRW9_9HYPO|nr:Acriflavine sensitivity control acr-2 [Fusarium acutatum]